MRNGRGPFTVGVVIFVAALVVVSSAAATVRKISFTSRVARGHQASLTVKVVPTARCSIKVIYENTVTNAFGLSAKRGGTITWRWRVGKKAILGRWPVKVDCGKSGRRIFYLRVVKQTPAVVGLTRSLYRAARISNNLGAIFSRSPRRQRRRAKNIVLGRMLGRAGV